MRPLQLLYQCQKFQFLNLNFATWPQKDIEITDVHQAWKSQRSNPQVIIDNVTWRVGWKKLSVLTTRPWNLSPLWIDNGLMEQDQMGCNQIGLHFELHPLQCRSQYQNKAKKIHYLLCMVELQSVTHMCGLRHNWCHYVSHRCFFFKNNILITNVAEQIFWFKWRK